jgi:WD40 repeat protein
VKLIDVATGTEARTLTYRTDPAWEKRYGTSKPDGCRAIAWSPDGRWLVVGTRSGQLVRWELNQPDPQPTVCPHSPPGPNGKDEQVRGMAFTPKGKVLVTWGHNQIAGWEVARKWREVFRKVGGGGQLTRPARPGDPIRFVAATGDPRYVVREAPPWIKAIDAAVLNAVGDRKEFAAGPGAEWCVNQWPNQHSLHLFRAAEPLPSAAFRLPGEDIAEEGTITDVAVHPAGRWVVSTSEHHRHLKVWSVNSGELVASETLGEGSGRVAFDPGGRTLAVTTDQCTMLYDIRPRGISETVGSGMLPLADADLTSDGGIGVSISPELKYGPPVRFDLRDPTGRPRQVVSEPDGIPEGNDNNRVVAIDPNDRWVCSTAGRWCRVRYFSDATRRLDFLEWSLRDLRADPLGRLWSTGAKGIHRWDFDTPGSEVGLHPTVTIGGSNQVMSDCIAPGRDDVWAGRTDGAVCRYPAAGGAADRVFPAFAVGVKGIARSGDGTRVLAGSAIGGVKLFDAESGRVVVDLPAAHRDAVRALAFLPGGGFVTGGSDRVVRLWNQSGQLVLSLPQTRPVRRVYVSADGRYLTLLAEGERSLRRWDLDALTATFREFGLEPGLR